MNINLYKYQYDAVLKMKSGCILCGGVGSGKSRTALAYFLSICGGKLEYNTETEKYGVTLNYQNGLTRDLYIITTARKRDTAEWEMEMAPFLLSSNPEHSHPYNIRVKVDSWNNIAKYKEVKNAFFIFDEQRVVGSGQWVKSFLKITKPDNSNHWILLSATPGDTWSDYIPVFIANGFFKNRTQFNREHIVFSPFTNFPKIEKYLGTRRLGRLRDSILVDMDFKRQTTAHHYDVHVEYDKKLYAEIVKKRWNPFTDEPLENASEYCHCLRRAVNQDVSRQAMVCEILAKRGRAIIFYNYDYELEILKSLHISSYGAFEVAEWNGHKHQPIPDSDCWMYLVQYNAGAEGWNCVKTDTIIFFSQNYSYKIMMQSSGRIDRLNTPYSDLYYYHFKSKAGIDVAIDRALRDKKKFNEGRFWEKL